MTSFLHWRKMTWALVLWSGYVATWAVITGSGPAIVTLWWLVGMSVLVSRAGARTRSTPGHLTSPFGSKRNAAEHARRGYEKHPAGCGPQALTILVVQGTKDQPREEP